MTVLDSILQYKREEVRLAKSNAPVRALEALAGNIKPRGFYRSLAAGATSGCALIAEIKRASPSKGLIRENFDPVAHARAYAAGGATCLSVLTDKPSFQGDPSYLRDIREAVSLPILRKDFMIDPYQVVEARAWGADCILLIMAALSEADAQTLRTAAKNLELDVLAEVHDQSELDRALQIAPEMIGINNRDLKTFETDLNVTRRLAPLVPNTILVVSESGISSNADIQALTASGAKAFLIGESLMRQDDITAATRSILGRHPSA